MLRCVVPPSRSPGKPVRLGDPLLDRYLEFVEARARFNTVLAAASDLRLFFNVVDKPPAEVTTQDVFDFIAVQRRPPGDGKVIRLVDGEGGLSARAAQRGGVSARTIKRLLSSVSGLFGWLVLCGELDRNPVPRGLATRRRGSRKMALIRTPYTLPTILSPAEVDALIGALRRWRDVAMIEAMVLAGLR